MNVNMQLETRSRKIAEAVVDVVNDAAGRVTLLQVEREVPGFAMDGLPAWYFAFHRAGGDGFVWGGMTEAGGAALRKIIYGRGGGIQFVTPLPFLLNGGAGFPHPARWLPIMLPPPPAPEIKGPQIF